MEAISRGERDWRLYFPISAHLEEWMMLLVLFIVRRLTSWKLFISSSNRCLFMGAIITAIKLEWGSCVKKNKGSSRELCQRQGRNFRVSDCEYPRRHCFARCTRKGASSCYSQMKTGKSLIFPIHFLASPGGWCPLTCLPFFISPAIFLFACWRICLET